MQQARRVRGEIIPCQQENFASGYGQAVEAQISHATTARPLTACSKKACTAVCIAIHISGATSSLCMLQQTPIAWLTSETRIGDGSAAWCDSVACSCMPNTARAATLCTGIVPSYSVLASCASSSQNLWQIAAGSPVDATGMRSSARSSRLCTTLTYELSETG